MGSVSAIDSRLFRNLFGTEEIRNIFSDTAYIARCIEVECALARAQARCNVIPQNASDVINEKLQKPDIDFEKLGKETDIVGYPILPPRTTIDLHLWRGRR